MQPDKSNAIKKTNVADFILTIFNFRRYLPLVQNDFSFGKVAGSPPCFLLAVLFSEQCQQMTCGKLYASSDALLIFAANSSACFSSSAFSSSSSFARSA